jgi:hypothetical protein
MQTAIQTENLDFNKVWLMFQETDKKFQETDKKFQETDSQQKENASQQKETDSYLKETARQLRETRSILDEKFQETDRILQKLTNQMKISESRWGRFVEALVEGSLVKVLNEFGILVNRTLTREKRLLDNDDYEIDIIAKNGEEIVAVEVKTTLGVSDVQDFLEKLDLFKKAFPDYKNNKLFGGIAYIQKDSDADKYAAKHGLIVIKAVGEGAKITNRKNFKPKSW